VLPLSARLDSVLSNILLPVQCSWLVELCMCGCGYLEWRREKKVFLEKWERDWREERRGREYG
jgi:hypothetical protein